MGLDMRKKKIVTGKNTQSFLRISEIKNDCVVLDDGTMRAVINVSSTNFDLKSQEEQDGIIFAFQRFLNSLEFPVQILMQSRKMEISGYLEKLKKMAEKQTNELLRVQTLEYVEFISRLIENASIMNKNFYIIVPIGVSILPKPPGFVSSLFGGQTKATKKRIENFEKEKADLDLRVDAVMANLGGMNLRGERLKTEDIIQLYYNSYNFDAGPNIDPTKLGEMKVVE